MSPPPRSKLVLFTAIPFLLLSSSQSTVVRTVVYLDGSVKREVSADFWQERQSNVLPHLRLALPQADRQRVAPIAEGLRGQRSVIVASAEQLEGAKLTYEDVVARPLSLFTYYTWTETIEIPRETATAVEKADPSKAVFKYEVTMPGRVQEARALPRKAEPKAKPTGETEAPGPPAPPTVPPAATPPAPAPAAPAPAPVFPAPPSESAPTPSGAPAAPTGPVPAAPPSVETAPSAPSPGPAAPLPEMPAVPSVPVPTGPAEAPAVPSTPPAAVSPPAPVPAPPPAAAPTPPAAATPPGPAAAPSAAPEAPAAGPSLQAETSGSTATFRLTAVHEAYDITVTSRRVRWGYVLTWLYVLAFIAYRLSAFLIHRARLRPRRI